MTWLAATQTKSLSHTLITLFRGQLPDVEDPKLHWRVIFATLPPQDALVFKVYPKFVTFGGFDALSVVYNFIQRVVYFGTELFPYIWLEPTTISINPLVLRYGG